MKNIRYADFGIDEYRWRIQRLQSAMDQAGLDALLVTDPANLRYIFGFQNLLQISATRSFVGVFVKDAPEESSLFIPRDCQDAPQTWVENVVFWDDRVKPPFDDLTVDTSKVFKRLDRLSLKQGHIGLELGDGMKLGMPPGQFDRLRSQLSEAVLLDASPVFWSVRKIKSAAEIEILRATAAISLTTIKSIVDSLREGVSEREICRQIHARMFNDGCDGQGFLSVQFGSDGWRRANMAPTDERRLKKNEWVYIDGGGLLMGYHSDFARTVLYGEAERKQL